MRLLLAFLLLLSGCSSYANLGQGHRGYLETMEARSPFGTNAVLYRAKHCSKVGDGFTNWFIELYNDPYTDCRWMTKEEQENWFPASSQGQGGQILQGLLMGAPIGAGLAIQGGANASSTIINQAAPAVKHGR